jgi:hypothetical protein
MNTSPNIVDISYSALAETNPKKLSGEAKPLYPTLFGSPSSLDIFE